MIKDGVKAIKKDCLTASNAKGNKVFKRFPSSFYSVGYFHQQKAYLKLFVWFSSSLYWHSFAKNALGNIYKLNSLPGIIFATSQLAFLTFNQINLGIYSFVFLRIL